MAALIKPKIAVFAPIPSASESTATVKNPGLFNRVRIANRTSWRNRSMLFLPQRCQWIQMRSPPGRQETRQQSDCQQGSRCDYYRRHIVRLHTEELAGHITPASESR